MNNSMPAGSDLPVEVLCSIFRYLSVGDFGNARRIEWLLSATHVCQKWRRAAIGLAELWAENLCALVSSAATDTFLERAQSAPLVICGKQLQVNGNLTNYQIALAEKHLARIRVLERPGPLPVSFVKALETTTMSNLNVLLLHRWANPENRSFLVEFSLSAPVLQELYLDSVFSKINAPLLRVLSVKNDLQPYQGTLQAVPTSAVLEFLSETPLLEELTLEGLNAFAAEDDDEAHDAKAVELPRLRSVHFKDEGNSYGLYRLVHAAPEADVSITNTLCDGEELGVTFQSMERHLRTHAYDTLIIYEDQDDGGTHVNVRLRSSASTRSYYDDDGEPEFRLDAFMDPMGEASSSLSIISTLVPHINIDSIHFLDLGETGTDEYAEFEADELRETLAPFTSVSTVMLNIDASRRHILALRSEGAGDDEDEDAEGEEEDGEEDGEGEGDGEGEDSGNKTKLPLPALQHLIVQDLTNPYEISIDALREGWAVLLAILKERKRAGRPVRYLTLSDRASFPGVAEDDLVAIQEQDREFLRRAEALVENVFDSRGYEQDYNSDYTRTGRISEYVKEL